MTPLKLYRQWFMTLSPMWAFEIASQIIRDATLGSALFYTQVSEEIPGDEYYEALAVEYINSSLTNLLIAIDEQIAAENLADERLLCQQIFSSTTYAIIKFTDTNVGFNVRLLESQIKDLAVDKLELVDLYDIWRKKSSQMQYEGSDLKVEWEEFTAQYFNIELFFRKEYQ